MLIRILSVEYYLKNKGQFANKDPFRRVLSVGQYANQVIRILNAEYYL